MIKQFFLEYSTRGFGGPASRVELRFINPFWFTLSRESSVQEHGIEKELDSADTLWEGSLASYMLNTCKSWLLTDFLLVRPTLALVSVRHGCLQDF